VNRNCAVERGPHACVDSDKTESSKTDGSKHFLITRKRAFYTNAIALLNPKIRLKMRFFVIVGCIISLARAYYVPGTYPREFKVGDLISGKKHCFRKQGSRLDLIGFLSNAANVNSLKSFDTELPFEYYTMPFCQPPEGIKRIADTTNPGTLLEGLRIENSPYNFTIKVCA